MSTESLFTPDTLGGVGATVCPTGRAVVAWEVRGDEVSGWVAGPRWEDVAGMPLGSFGDEAAVEGRWVPGAGPSRLDRGAWLG